MLISSWLLAALFVSIVSASILGAGALVSFLFRKQISHLRADERGVLAALTGLSVFTVVSLFVGLIPGGYSIVPQNALVLFGLYGFFRFRPKWSGWLGGADHKIWLLFPVLYFLTRIFSAGLPQQHNDALYYHLAAPKLWAQLGQIRLVPEHPSFAQSTLFETLYGLPQLWLGTAGHFAHITTQIFGQWMHVLWGQILTLAVVMAIFRKVAPGVSSKRRMLVFLSWLVTTLPCVEWTGGLAKNDYIVAAFALGAVLPFLLPLEGWLIATIAGFFAGIAFGEKMVAVSTVVALPILAFSIRDRKALGCLVFGAILGIFPIALRNTIWMGNPVFPMFDDVIGPGWTSFWWRDHNATFSGFFKFDPAMFSWIWFKGLEKLLPKILCFVTIAGFFLGLRARFTETTKRHAPRQHLWFFALAQLALLVSTLRSNADGRYGGYALTLLFVLGISELLEKGWVLSLRFPQFFAVALFPLGVLINSPVDLLVKIPKNWLFQPAESYVLKFHLYQQSKEKMNEMFASANPKPVIVALADKANFYLDLPYESYAEMSKWDEVHDSAVDTDDYLLRIRAKGYRWFYLQTHFTYPPPLAKFWTPLMARAKECGVFLLQDVMLVDLDCVAGKTGRAHER